MDIFSHFLSGYVLIELLNVRGERREALILGAVFPDFDFALELTYLSLKKGLLEALREILTCDFQQVYHGTATHSLIMAPLFALAPMFIVGRRIEGKNYFYSLIGIYLHLFFDGLSRGNMLFWPVICSFINVDLIPTLSPFYPLFFTLIAIPLLIYRKIIRGEGEGII